jgi:hypothetical protein
MAAGIREKAVVLISWSTRPGAFPTSAFSGVLGPAPVAAPRKASNRRPPARISHSVDHVMEAITDSCMGSARWAQWHQLLQSIHRWPRTMASSLAIYSQMADGSTSQQVWFVILVMHRNCTYLFDKYVLTWVGDTHRFSTCFLWILRRRWLISRLLLQELVERSPEIRFGYQRKGLLYFFSNLISFFELNMRGKRVGPENNCCFS